MSEEIKRYFEPGRKNLILIYILFLCGVLAPLLCIIGAVLAYVNKDEAHGIYKSHYIFILRTFWIALCGMMLSIIGALIIIGIFLSIIVKIWYVIRVILGMNLLIKDGQHPNPQTWLFIK